MERQRASLGLEHRAVGATHDVGHHLAHRVHPQRRQRRAGGPVGAPRRALGRRSVGRIGGPREESVLGVQTDRQVAEEVFERVA